jgi:lysophospholipase L1-like esterase
MKRNLRAFLCLGLLGVAMPWLAGCGGDSSDSTGAAAAAATNSSDSASGDTNSVTDASGTLPHFPDGLHPDATASASIAAAFNDRISSSPSGIGDNDPNVIVCLGDSITLSGYPGILAGMTGKTCVNEGKPGEESGGGASRVAGVLEANKPAYLCIMYGSNDVHSHLSFDSVISHLATIIASARAHNTIPILATIPPMSGPRFGGLAGDVRDLNNMIRSLASSSGTALADVEREF